MEITDQNRLEEAERLFRARRSNPANRHQSNETVARTTAEDVSFGSTHVLHAIHEHLLDCEGH